MKEIRHCSRDPSLARKLLLCKRAVAVEERYYCARELLLGERAWVPSFIC